MTTPAGHDPRALANVFIQKSMGEGNPATPMEVQKLMFFAHGWTLGIHGKPLHYDEWEAWRYGPVLPVIYHNLSYFVADPVTDKIAFADPPSFDADEMAIIDAIHRDYRPVGAIRLSRLTHQKGSPWDQTRKKRLGNNLIIPNEVIQRYYHRKAVEAGIIDG